MYYIDIEHKGLGKFRRISGADKYVVEQKTQAQQYTWNEQWQRKCAIDAARTARTNMAFLKEQKKADATKRTEEAEREITALKDILLDGIKQTMKFDWSNLYESRKFPDAQPTPPAPMAPQEHEPSCQSDKYRPRKSILSQLFPSIRRRYEEEAHKIFLNDHEIWAKSVGAAKGNFQNAYAIWIEREADFQKRRADFERRKADADAKIDEFRGRYNDKDGGAITEYIDWVLALSDHPDCFPKQWQMDFIAETGILIIDYELPSVDVLPKLKAVKFVQSRDAFEESYLRENELAQLYESALYQTCLRTLHEVFSSDEVDAVKSVTFNGWVDFIDKSNGRHARACIMSLQASKNTFASINLAAVDPKACFRSLKGVGSAKLAGMSAIVPILRLNKDDKRFVPAHDAIDNVDAATNVAAISWEEFEYLVRDIFEKEFSKDGGEVKITRASRDHGVDAVAFDPDPIRGGKIVIQAKRYTNVVGVSAVRDLYGTLINEGANRGILVTTSQYGPDSYAFAKDKPITLLDGGNLLSLLERHGHRARIDLDEARKLGALRDERP